MFRIQKDVQKIYQEVLEPELEKQSNEDIINIGFTQDEFRTLLLFISTFAYD